jgi:Ca-activated chloride channel family protein
MMDALRAFHFLRPWALIAIAPAVLLWLAERSAADTTARWLRVIDPVLLKELTVEGQRASRISPADALLAAWIVGVAALAGPTWRLEPPPFADADPPAMIVLRVTPSMTTTDLAPSRLERAREKISDLLDLREGAATGLIAYSGSAHLVLPPTTDKSVVLTMAQALSPDIMPRQGDRLADAVQLAASVLTDARAGGSILVIADTAAPDQASALENAKRANGPPLTLLAMAPPARVSADAALNDAARALNARLVVPTPDTSDVENLASRLRGSVWSGDVAGEGAQWRDEGYWLTPIVALISLAWFRRGWLIAR